MLTLRDRASTNDGPVASIGPGGRRMQLEDALLPVGPCPVSLMTNIRGPQEILPLLQHQHTALLLALCGLQVFAEEGTCAIA